MKIVSYIKLIFFIKLISISTSIEIKNLSKIYFVQQFKKEEIVGGNTAAMINLTKFGGNLIRVQYEIKNNQIDIDTLYQRFDNKTIPYTNFYTNYSVKLNKFEIDRDRDYFDYYSIYEFIIPKNENEYYNYLTVINPDYHNMSIYSYSFNQEPKSKGDYTTYIIIGVVLGFILCSLIIRMIIRIIARIRIKRHISSDPLCVGEAPDPD